MFKLSPSTLICYQAQEFGGGTFDSNARQVDYSSGYFVAVQGGVKTPFLTPQIVQQFVTKYFLDVPDCFYYLGIWFDEESTWRSGKGVWYLDRSVWISDLAKALEFGKDHEQLAIFDCENKQEIRLDA